MAQEIRKPPRWFDYSFRMIVDYGGNNYEYNIPTADLVSFVHDRVVGDKANKFTFTIKGDLSLDLEYKILTGNRQVLIAYGFVNSDDPIKIFTGEITDADIKFEGLSMAIVFQGVSSVFTDDRVKRKVIYKKGTSVYKILSLICGAHNWVLGEYVEARDIAEDLVQSDQTDVDFLSDVLSEKSYSKDRGINDYKVWFTTDGSRIVLNYTPLCYKGDVRHERLVYDLNATANSRMLSFEVKDMGKFAYAVGTSLKAKAINPDTGEMVEFDSSDIKQAYGEIAQNYGEIVGKNLRTIFNNDNSSIMKTSLLNNARDKMNAYWQKMYNQNYTASAVLIGDTLLEAGDSIDIVVMLKDGTVHYSSGVYRITEMHDKFEGGAFISELGLVKTVAKVGVN